MSFLKNSKRKKETSKFFNIIKQGNLNDLKHWLDKGKTEFVNKRDDDEWTPIFWTCFNGNYEMTKLLLNNGAEVGIEDKQGRTPLYLHCGWHGDAEITKLLIRSGSNVLARNKDGWSCLHISAFKGITSPIEVLVDAGADVLQVDNNKRTPIELAILKKQEEVVTIFKRLAKNLLFSAVKQGKTSVIQPLIEKFSLDVNAKDLTGWTSLHFAVQNGNETTVKMLLSYGADPQIANMKGQTPETIASENGNLHLVRVLKQHLEEIERQNKSNLMKEREDMEILIRKEAIKDKTQEMIRKRSSTSSASSSSVIKKDSLTKQFPILQKPSSPPPLLPVEINTHQTPLSTSSSPLSVGSDDTSPVQSNTPKEYDKSTSILDNIKRQTERKTAIQLAKEEALSKLSAEERAIYEQSKKSYQVDDFLTPTEYAYFHPNTQQSNGESGDCKDINNDAIMLNEHETKNEELLDSGDCDDNQYCHNEDENFNETDNEPFDTNDYDDYADDDGCDKNSTNKRLSQRKSVTDCFQDLDDLLDSLGVEEEDTTKYM